MIPALIFGNGWESNPDRDGKEVGGKHVPPPGGRSLLKGRAPAHAARWRAYGPGNSKYGMRPPVPRWNER